MTVDTSIFPAPDANAVEAVLSARNVAKIFGSIQALKGVNFDVHRGQVTTLFGENGAGKSTLMKILSGVYKPTSGQIILDGAPIEFDSSTEARDHGITGHIFNLGHGVLPTTDPEVLTRVVDLVHSL